MHNNSEPPSYFSSTSNTHPYSYNIFTPSQNSFPLSTNSINYSAQSSILTNSTPIYYPSNYESSVNHIAYATEYMNMPNNDPDPPPSYESVMAQTIYPYSARPFSPIPGVTLSSSGLSSPQRASTSQNLFRPSNGQANPTVWPARNFDPINDAAVIYRALSVEEPNKDILINVLCKRSLQQRLQIAHEYQKTYGKLARAIETRLWGGNFRNLLISLITPLDLLDVITLHEALDKYDFDIVADILCTKSNNEIILLKNLFGHTYRRSLESFISTKTGVNYKKLLLAICNCIRDETSLNLQQAQEDARIYAKTLHNSNVYESPDATSIFHHIFTTRSFEQIKLICEEYQEIYRKPIDQKIKKEFSTSDKQGYLVIARYTTNKNEFFARRLHKSMQGLATHNEQLIRIIVTRSEIDLKDIMDFYNSMQKKGLKKAIEGSTSSHYKLALCTLIGYNEIDSPSD